MPTAPSPTPHDPGGTLTLRPRSATAIVLVGTALGAALALEAVLRSGWQGILALPLLLLILALLWALLWAPRVVLHEDAVEVRNVVATHVAPFTAIEAVRIGAMLRLDVRGRRGDLTTITAWNAPALGRDNPLRREASIHEQSLGRRRSTREERLVRDQQRSRSAVVRERWLEAMDRRDRERGASDDHQVEGAVLTTRPNIVVLAVVGVCFVLAIAQLLL